jgi:membrane-bound metal-dependent hydrolase YbcI (DUF457 family)
MFIGHYSAALAAAVHPKAPRLGTLFIGAQLVDFAFFSFNLIGVENMHIVPGTTVMNPMDLYDMPFTHSLVGSLAWALGFALILRSMTREWTGPIIGGAVVLSHWLLDVVVHGPDMSLVGSPPKFGFGLWNHPMTEMPLEIALVLGSAWVFARSRGLAGKARTALHVLIGVLLVVQAYNWFAPAPTEVSPVLPISALLAFALASWLAYRVDTFSAQRNSL